MYIVYKLQNDLIKEAFKIKSSLMAEEKNAILI